MTTNSKVSIETIQSIKRLKKLLVDDQESNKFNKRKNRKKMINSLAKSCRKYIRSLVKPKIQLNDIPSIGYTSEKDLILFEKNKFKKFNLDSDSALTKLNTISEDLFGAPFNRSKGSVHWLLAAAISETFECKKILEIGTEKGEFTRVLASLFPSAEIITVDLPSSDPLYADLSLYGRGTEQGQSTFQQHQEKNLKSPNITYQQVNSFFLNELPRKSFDLIWADGAHDYPAISWDICNAYHLCKEGGYVLIDDVLNFTSSNSYNCRDAYEILEYIRQRTDKPIEYFLKRTSKATYNSKKSRKYVGLIKC